MAPLLSGSMKLKGHGVVHDVTITARFPFCLGIGMPLGLSPMNIGTLRSKSSFNGAHMFPQCVGVPITKASAFCIFFPTICASSSGKMHVSFSRQAMQAVQYFMLSLHTSIHSISCSADRGSVTDLRSKETVPLCRGLPLSTNIFISILPSNGAGLHLPVFRQVQGRG